MPTPFFACGVSRQRPFLALFLTLPVLTLTSVTMTLPAVLAPEAAVPLGFEVEHVGYLVGLAYVLAMFSGLLSSSYVPRFGAMRLSQFSMLLCAVALAAMSFGSLLAFLSAGVVTGLAYGLTNPTSAVLLGEHTPVHRRGLVFSLKQTGMPLGIAIAGGLGPRLYESFGWQLSMLAAAGLCLAFGLVVQFFVHQFDGALQPALRPGWRDVFAPLVRIGRRQTLRRLALVSMLYALVQVCLVTFLVAHLTLSYQLGLSHAAAILAFAQVSSVLARPFWGWVADRSGAPARLLGWLGVGTALSCAVLALLPAGVSGNTLLLVSLVCAATGIGWNGVFYAELIHQAGKSELAGVTAGVQFLTFAGAMAGPVLFANIVAFSGSYTVALLALVAAALGGGLWLLLAHAEK